MTPGERARAALVRAAADAVLEDRDFPPEITEALKAMRDDDE